jgi:TRAP-type uncharacterized transport system substrate-binding protein
MRRWRTLAIAAAGAPAGALLLAAMLEFLTPHLAYHLQDRAAEWVSGQRGRTFRIALGAATGSSYRVGTVLNRYLRDTAGYELDLVVTAAPGNVAALLDPRERIDLAIVSSADDDAARAQGVAGVAALESQYFFVVVPNDSPVREFRDLSGAVNPGVRQAGQPPTLGERVLEYYGLLAPRQPADGPARVSIVRPTQAGVVVDFDSGHMAAATRTQLLRTGLMDEILDNGRFRLVPLRDHEALARSLPGTRPALIPAGLYGPGRRIPAEPVPTIAVTQLMVARGDVPGRVVRDILEVIYDPRFGRDLQFELTEEAGRKVGGLALHQAASIYYHRNDLPTSDRLGRLSFVASVVAALAATLQFVSRYRRNERVAGRRRLLGSELAKLEAIRERIDESADEDAARLALRDADDLLWNAEQDAAADLLDMPGIQSLRSLHRLCWSTGRDRIQGFGRAGRQPLHAPSPPPAAESAPTAPAMASMVKSGSGGSL